MPSMFQDPAPIRTADGCHAPYAPRVLPPETSRACFQTLDQTSNFTSLNQACNTRATTNGSSTFVPLISSLPPPSYHKHHQPCGHDSGAFTASQGPASFLVEPVHAVGLSGHCDFVQVPSGFEALVSEDAHLLAEVLASGQMVPPPLFIGQVRFEMSAGELHWLLKRLCGVHTLKIEPRGLGCFCVVAKSSEDSDALLALHRRLLFDHQGVWYARTADESAVLESYVATTASRLPRRSRLPRDAMIVERQRGSLDPLRSILGFFMPIASQSPKNSAALSAALPVSRAAESSSASQVSQSVFLPQASDSLRRSDASHDEKAVQVNASARGVDISNSMLTLCKAAELAIADDRSRCNSDSTTSIAGLSQGDVAESLS